MAKEIATTSSSLSPINYCYSDSEEYEDAKMSSIDDLYDDILTYQVPQSCRNNISKINGKYEYDIPNIAFSFLDRANQSAEGFKDVTEETFENPAIAMINCDERVDVRGDECDATIINAPPPQISDKKPRTHHVTELKITLTPCCAHSKSETALDVANANQRRKKRRRTATIAVIPLLRNGDSDDPNSIQLRHPHHQQTDDILYQVPMVRHCTRLSQSLNNLDAVNDNDDDDDDEEQATEIMINSTEQPSSPLHLHHNQSTHSSMTMDYCKTRSRMPAQLRRITLLRKPRTNRGATTWHHVRTKITQFTQQQARIRTNMSKLMGVFGRKQQQQQKDGEAADGKNLVKNDAFFANSCANSNGDDSMDQLSPSPDAIEAIYSKSTTSSIGAPIPHASTNGRPRMFNYFSDDRKDCADLPHVSTKQVRVYDWSIYRPANSKRALREYHVGQNGFDDIRRYVKQGGDFCKELASILQERSEIELQYAKNLSKLGAKLSRVSRDSPANDAWKCVAIEMESRAEAHRILGNCLHEDVAKPLRNLTENQHKCRKYAESAVDKNAKGLGEWRAAEAKAKKHSHTCSRDNEKLQDTLFDAKLQRSSSLIQLNHSHKAISEKETAKLEGKKRKAEDAVKKADIEYYTHCVRAERARLEWESAVLRGSTLFQTLEEERLNNLKSTLSSYFHHTKLLAPKLIEIIDRLQEPIANWEPQRDLAAIINLRNSSQQSPEQLLPDFYCEHITLAMNRERRKQALVKLLHLIRQDIERERKSKNGLENLSKAMKQTPTFGAEESQQNVSEKLYHMKSMLTYLEGARYKVQSALAELDSNPRTGHPLAPHITITRDKSGLQQSVLKVPQWLRDEWIDSIQSSQFNDKYHSNKMDKIIAYNDEWDEDRGAADGHSNRPESDFDDFSSIESSSSVIGGTNEDEDEEKPEVNDDNSSKEAATASSIRPIARCKALYAYNANLPDELTLQPDDCVTVYQKQEDGWWLGECKGTIGIFPATYVEIVDCDLDPA